MRDEKIINDLFEAARTEQAVRSLNSVEQFVRTAPASTSFSLVIQWLKRNKMNMLISTSGVIITATILLFPKQEMIEKNVIAEVNEPVVEQVETVEPPETNAEPVMEVDQPKQDFKIVPEEEDQVVEEKRVEVKPLKDTAEAMLVVSKNPQAKARRVNHDQASPTKESKVTEHLVVLQSREGRASVKEFSEYLASNLSQLSHEFTSSASKSEIRKFTLKLDNRYQADFRMQVTGFEKMELHWETDADGELRNMWYRLDSKETKELDFSKFSKFSVKVKHKHQEF